MATFYIVTAPDFKGYGELIRNVDGMLYMARCTKTGERIDGHLLYVDAAYCTEAVRSLDTDCLELVEA